MNKLTLITLFLFSLIFSKQTLNTFERKITSQFGEDGIIEEIFKNIGFASKVFLEFGGQNGPLSNTEYMMIKYNVKGIFIEADHESCCKLAKYMSKYDAKIIESFVDGEGNNTLENILQKNNIAFDIDMVSIDIDGNDYWILNSLDKLKPRLIICEYNSTIPSHIDIYQPYKHGEWWSFGSSIKSITRIAEQKGYTLVATTLVNAFFVRNDLIDKLDNFNLEYECIATSNRSSLANIIIDMRGNYLIVSSQPEKYYGYSALLHGIESSEITPDNFLTKDNCKILNYLGLQPKK